MSDADGLRYTKIPLNNGSDEIPALGFGTLIPDPIATKRQSGSRWRWAFVNSIAPNATEMKNTWAKQCGRCSRRARSAEGVFVGTKLWNNNHRPERVRPAFEASLRRLQLDYVDWSCKIDIVPVPCFQTYLEGGLDAFGTIHIPADFVPTKTSFRLTLPSLNTARRLFRRWVASFR